ncbi:GNAT family N-acetyltransferase [Massilia pseudoviolaceinigra]|uniref:GNAT family N-acetyltransferase n=1 Tax=Massilia pseudoviolaceinigra TaxID=3057165 RepID=UPI0027964CB8|nr:GNAT family protein [Massilia sp. CCM 9206]MDQ1920922.1 GNAT family protein [Massilia sp. CCM 9206]
MNFKRPETLSGPNIVLEPLLPCHREPLRAAAADDSDIWRYFPVNFNGAGQDFDPWFDYTLQRYAEGMHYPFAVRRRSDAKIIGTTRFYDMSYDHRRLSIGSTWYLKEARGTLVNAEVRLLTMSYAFERLAINRLEMITDVRNLNSRAAMRILGAVQEGIMRNHMIYKDGRVRDSILYSIIAPEWPEVKHKLMSKLDYVVEQLAY